MTEITATVVVRFGELVSSADSANGCLSIKVDDRPDGFNNGNTSFLAGSDIGFLIYKSDNVTQPVVKSSTGVLGISGGGTIIQLSGSLQEITEILTFGNTDNASLSFPAANSFAHIWLGRAGLGITLENQKTIKLDEKHTGVVEVTYTANVQQAILRGTPSQLGGRSSYPIIISAVGQLIE